MPAALRLALVALLVGTRITTAQETATEQVAAADVIRRMSELERSLALPQLVARLAGARDARRDAVIARAKDLMDRELLALADDIPRPPETRRKSSRRPPRRPSCTTPGSSRARTFSSAPIHPPRLRHRAPASAAAA